MSTRAFFVFCLLAFVEGAASASPGDVFVPAHRTRDGSYVPANVAPMSGGSVLSTQPTRHAAGPGAGAGASWRRLEASRPTRIKVAGSRPTP